MQQKQLKIKKWMASHEDITRYYITDPTGSIHFGYIQEIEGLDPDRTFRVKNDVLNSLLECYGSEAELIAAIKNAATTETLIEV